MKAGPKGPFLAMPNTITLWDLPKCRLNADANTPRAVGILIASVGVLRPSRFGAS